ncbi:MAG: hypothetical protein JNK73_03970 [Bacteroidia bacterium]|nr:hypothetical protein [Bacteroidia bacterium]
MTKDLNSEIRRGMKGVILEKYDDKNFLVEFVKKDGTNFEYEGESFFTIDSSFMTGQ